MSGNFVIVTGGSRGIGYEIVKNFLENNYSVLYTFLHNNDKFEDLKEIADKNNVICEYYKLDVSKSNEVKEFANWFEGKGYNLLGLVNNAGIAKDNLLINMSDEEWNEVININLNGTFYMCREFTKFMLMNRKGFIINMASINGIKGTLGGSNYAASKGGIIALSRSLGYEVSSFGIRVNALAPGYIETDMTSGLSEKQSMLIKRNIQLKRFGKPKEVANMVMFLAKGEHFLQNSVIEMDGGRI